MVYTIESYTLEKKMCTFTQRKVAVWKCYERQNISS